VPAAAACVCAPACSDFIPYSSNAWSHKRLLCCGLSPVDCDQPDLNHGWAAANHTQRLALAAAHKYYLLGSLYFMANDPRCGEVCVCTRF
jgi:hypothetical protein